METTTSLGSMFQCLTTLSGKKFFLISILNLPCCNLRTFPYILIWNEVLRWSALHWWTYWQTWVWGHAPAKSRSGCCWSWWMGIGEDQNSENPSVSWWTQELTWLRVMPLVQAWGLKNKEWPVEDISFQPLALPNWISGWFKDKPSN